MNMGIGKDKIGDVIMDTIKNGKVIGYQGKGKGRPIYETVKNGKRREIAITIGDNGYVVGANPKSK